MTVDVLQHYVANNDSLKNKRAKVTITRYRSDGTAEVFTYHNAKLLHSQWVSLMTERLNLV